MIKRDESLESFLEVIRYLNKENVQNKNFEFELNDGQWLKLELLKPDQEYPNVLPTKSVLIPKDLA